ncbi:MAG: hypothetical protein L6R38_003615 [Xanthoria sp. 2 TBL-2021]|nr:MAG: hypothetical protein L6R38_003615 [Xanthoria sp. 2 TBL-2021]
MFTLFGTLTNFTCLKRLGIPEAFLVDRRLENENFEQLLPPTLEILQLQYGMGFKQSYVEERHLRVVHFLNLPRLKRFIWWDQQAECLGARTYEASSEVFELSNKLRRHVVIFRYTNTPYYKETPLAGDESSDSFEHGFEQGFTSRDSSAEGFSILGEEFDDGEWLDEHLEM